MLKAVLTVLLFVLLVALWPMIYWVSNYLWFGVVDRAVNQELIVFLPMGAISALAVLLPQLSRKYSGCLLSGLTGYMIAMPIAYFSTLYGGLVLNPWLSATVVGSLPLLVFTFVGYKIGEMLNSHKQGLYHY